MRTGHTLNGPLPTTFGELNALHALRPIKDAAGYDNAIEVLDRLAVLNHPTPDQADYLATLTQLVGAYDDEHHALDRSGLHGLDLLRYLLDENGMNASALGELLGNRSLGSKVLRGERALSKSHIRTLAERFKVSPGLLL